MIRHGESQASKTRPPSTNSRERSKPPPLPVSHSSESASPKTEADAAGPTGSTIEDRPRSTVSPPRTGRLEPPPGRRRSTIRRSRFLQPHLFAAAGVPDPVPPLEPPAVLAVRCSPRRIRRVWVHNRVRELPCWLLSCFTHMAIFILLALLVVPLGNRENRRAMILLFPESAGEEDEIATVEPVILLRDRALPSDEHRPLRELPPEPELIEPVLEDPQPDEPDPDRPDPHESGSETAPNVNMALSDPALDAAPLLLEIKPRGACGTVPIPRVTVLGQVMDPITSPVGSVATSLFLPARVDRDATRGTSRTSSRSQQQMDGIVDRFILYDIGQLEGADALQAKQEFDQLGPEAIPALVRGLNKSAGFRQSCPVCVISNKLGQALQETDDPAMIAYALENIGRGVSDRAPHAARVRGLKERWVGQVLQKRGVIRTYLRNRGLPTTDGMVDQVRLLVAAPPAEVEAALNDPEARTRLAAVIALQTRAHLGDPNNDAATGHLLAGALEDDDPIVQGIARESSIRLANGVDLGPDPQTWQDYWNVVGGARKMSRGVPKELVAGLDHPEWPIRLQVAKAVAINSDRLSVTQRAELGQRLSGLLLDGQPEVRQVTREALVALAGGYQLDTGEGGGEPQQRMAANRWRDYWQRFEMELATEPRAESLFVMARTLEERGRVDEATDRYRRIIIEYRDSTAATRARDRLDAITVE